MITLVNKNEATGNRFYCNLAQPQNHKCHFTVFWHVSVAYRKEHEMQLENYWNGKKVHIII